MIWEFRINHGISNFCHQKSMRLPPANADGWMWCMWFAWASPAAFQSPSPYRSLHRGPLSVTFTGPIVSLAAYSCREFKDWRLRSACHFSNSVFPPWAVNLVVGELKQIELLLDLSPSHRMLRCSFCRAYMPHRRPPLSQSLPTGQERTEENVQLQLWTILVII